MKKTEGCLTEALNKILRNDEIVFLNLSYEDMKEAYQQTSETFIHKLEQGKKTAEDQAACWKQPPPKLMTVPLKPVADAFSRYA